MNSPYTISHLSMALAINFMMNPNPHLQLTPQSQAPDLYVSIWPLGITTWTAPRHLQLKIVKIELFSFTFLLKPPPPLMFTLSVNGVTPAEWQARSLGVFLDSSYSPTHSFTFNPTPAPTYFSNLISQCIPSLSSQHWLPSFHTCCSLYLVIHCTPNLPYSAPGPMFITIITLFPGFLP